jgi:aromatic-L-amino-acid decarboxylase
MHFAALVSAAPGFELCAPVTMGVVCFRFVPEAGDADAINERIVEQINASGKAYLTHTRLRGRTCMRVGFGNVQTTQAHVDAVWQLIRAEA